jgi:hypothetical protein
MRRVGLTTGRLRSGRLEQLPAATLLQSRPGIGAPLALLVVGSLALHERLAGSGKTLLTFFLSDWISQPLTVLTAHALARLGSERGRRIAADVDTGSSAAAFGALASALLRLPRRQSLPVFVAVGLYLVASLPTDDLAASIAHIYGTLAGLGLGFLWRRSGAGAARRTAR